MPNIPEMFFARIVIVLAAVLFCDRLSAAEKVSVRLNWVPGTEHSYLYLGREKGWYAAAGIDLDPDPVWECLREPRVGPFDTTGGGASR